MDDNGTRAALATLIGTDFSVADTDELAAASRAVARVQSFVDLAKVQISRRTRQLSDQGDTNANHVLVEEGRLSGKDAKNSDERDRVCEELPGFEDALADGRCTADHIDALAHHARGLTDAERADLADVAGDLVDNATTMPIGVFDRTTKGIIDKIRNMHRPDSDTDELDRQRKASKVKRWTDRDTGMKHTLISLDPIRDATLWNAINHHLERLRQDPANKGRPFDELKVEALMAAIGGGGPAERIPEIILLVDHGTMCHGLHDDTVCETIDGEPVPAATAQRLCCEAILTAVIVNPDGTVDRICQEQRTAGRQQRRMLAAMYDSCVHPHCQVPFSQCRIHHVHWFSRGGKTVLANMVPLCETHHHLVHEGGWNLTIDAGRRITWYKPDGTVWLTDQGPNRTARRRSTATSPTDAAEPSPHPPAPSTASSVAPSVAAIRTTAQMRGERQRPATPSDRRSAPPPSPSRQPAQPSSDRQRRSRHRPQRSAQRPRPDDPDDSEQSSLF